MLIIAEMQPLCKIGNHKDRYRVRLLIVKTVYLLTYLSIMIKACSILKILDLVLGFCFRFFIYFCMCFLVFFY